jgi:hypothetical protein
VSQGCDSAYHSLIGDGGSAGASSDKRRRQGHGGEAAAVGILVQCGAELGHVCMWGHE